MSDARTAIRARQAVKTPHTLSKYAIRMLLYVELLVLDCLSISAGFVLAGKIRGEEWVSPAGFSLTLLVVPAYALLAINRNAYSLDALQSLMESLRRSLTALFMTMLIILMFGFFFQAGTLISRLAFAAGICSSGLFLAATRTAFHYYARGRYPHGLVDELVIVDGAYPPGLRAPYLLDATREDIQPDLHNPEMLNRIATCLQGFDRVVISCVREHQHAWSLLLKGLNIRGEILLDESNKLGALGLGRYGLAETLIISRGPLSMANRAKKRLLDLAVTIPALIFFAPLFLILALLIKLESPGPVFFSQVRVGRSNRQFNILKFRSMRAELCDEDGQRSTERNDDRITRIGAFIRRTSIDELPQLINVLRGDMSLVGPRPHALGSLAGGRPFWEIDEQYWIRHALKPGITGLAQIRGYRGATQEPEDLERRLGADLEYVSNWRLWRDISILFATVRVIIHRNAY